MVAQRGQGLSTSPVLKSPRGKADPKVQTAAPKEKRKLSFKEKHALETMPARIAALQAEATRHRAVLADANLYARDRGKLPPRPRRLPTRRPKSPRAEEDWLALEILREEIEG